MKKVTAVVLLMFALGSSVSLLGADLSLFKVRLSGTIGLRFSGTILTTNEGASESKSVDGALGAEAREYTLVGDGLSVVFQKKSEDGTLLIEIIRDGKTVKTVTTSAEYGTVSVAL